MNKSGFTLVEIALALLVMSIGIVSIVGLFPAGLKANKVSIDETRAAMFADEVFGGLRSLAQELPWNNLEQEGIPTPAEDLWWDDVDYINSLYIPLINASIRTNIYIYNKNNVNDPHLVAYAVRYKLDIIDFDPQPVKGVILQVWNGSYGALKDGHTFYTELYYNGI